MSGSIPRRSVAVIFAAILLLALAAPVAADEPTLVGSLSFDAAATFDPQTKEITLTGSVECAKAGILQFFADATQQIGQHTVPGHGAGLAVCTAALGDVPVTVTLSSGSGFNPGTVDFSAFFFSCDDAGCADGFLEMTVEARPTNNAQATEPAPANDDAGAAQPIGYKTITQSSVWATGAETDPSCPGVRFIDHSLWYSFTAPADSPGGLAISTFGSDYDTVVVVLDASGGIVGCNDDAVPGVLVHSELTVPVTAGAPYRIVIGTWEDTPGGHLQLELNPADAPITPEPTTPPANDEPVGAVALAVGGSASQPESVIATATTSADPLDAQCDLPVAFNTNTVWYSVTPTADGWLDVNTFDSGYDTTLYVFQGSTLLACNDQAGLTNQSQVIFEATADVTYLIMVGAWEGTPPGDLVISAATSPPPLVVDVTFDGATVSRGDLTVSGSVTCSAGAEVTIFVAVFQEGGRFVAEGFGGVEAVSCGPEEASWSTTVTGTSRFQNGSAFVVADFSAAATDGRLASGSVDTQLSISPAGSNRR